MDQRWRKSTKSGLQDCVEVCMEVRWRKSSHSGGEGGNCIELAWLGAVRDSKNPNGRALAGDIRGLLSAVKAGRFDIVNGMETT